MNGLLTSPGNGVPVVDILPPLAPISAMDEVNHRVANSLQMLSAMVGLEARGVIDDAARRALENTQRRIAAVADVHRHLYQWDRGGTVDLAVYIRKLGVDLGNSQPANRRILLDLDPVIVRSEVAVSIGIIVSELVSNAFKYAYEAGVGGDVGIGLRGLSAGGYLIEVFDRGHGLAGSSVRGTGFGSRLIEIMTRRIGGRLIHQDARPGTRFILSVDA